MKAAVVQFETSHSIKQNLEKAYTLVEEACQQGADVVCMPEFFSYPWFPCHKEKDLSFFKDDNTLEQSISIAKTFSIYLVITYYEMDGDNQYNTAAIIAPNGKIIGKCRKNHLPEVPYYFEKTWYSPGNYGLPVFDTDIGRIGLLICSDAMFLQNAQILQLKGAELLFVPRCVVKAGNYRWRQMLIANTIISGCYLFSANRTGQYKEMEFDGHSIMVEPGGIVDKEAGYEEGVYVSKVNLEKVRQTQAQYPCVVEPNLQLYIDEFKALKRGNFN